MRLGLKAHASLADTCRLGWDIAITPDGPAFLETNSGCDVSLSQIAARAPLGDSLLAGFVKTLAQQRGGQLIPDRRAASDSL